MAAMPGGAYFVLEIAAGSEVVLIERGAGGDTEIVYDCETEMGVVGRVPFCELLSVTTMVNEDCRVGWFSAGTEGLPTIEPDVVSESPCGNVLPDFSENVSGVTPPVTVMVWLYGIPLAAFGKVVVVN